MKKILSIATASTILFSSSIFAEMHAKDFQGHRVGVGYSSTDWNDGSDSVDLGSGFKLEYGYDFNHIVGVNVSYETNQDDESQYGLKAEVEGSTFKVSTDLGYAFGFDGFSVKPYGTLGLARDTQKLTLSFAGSSESDKSSDTSVLLGLGARAQLDMGIYTDIRFEATSELDQFSWTFGYKF